MTTGRENGQRVLFHKSTGSSKKGGCRKRGKAPQLTHAQKVAFLAWTTTTWWPTRNAVLALLAFECGLRPIEIARLEWGLAFDVSWGVRPRLLVHHTTSKGGYGERNLRINPSTLGAALEQLRAEARPWLRRHVLLDFRSGGVDEYSRSRVVQAFFRAGYDAIGLQEHSSYSGRRTAVTQLYLNLGQREAQLFAGHRNPSTTAGYIDIDHGTVDRFVEDHLAVRLPRVLKMAKAAIPNEGSRSRSSARGKTQRSRRIA